MTIVEDIIQNQRHQSTIFIESHYLFLEVTCFISKTTEYVDLSRRKIFLPNTALTEETFQNRQQNLIEPSHALNHNIIS